MLVEACGLRTTNVLNCSAAFSHPPGSDMKRLLLIALSAGFLMQPLAASAQALDRVPLAEEYMQFVGAGSAVPGSFPGGSAPYVGPYTAQFLTGPGGSPTSAQFSIYCVDYFHGATSQWVDVSELSAANMTTGAGLEPTRAYMSNAGTSYQKYSQAVYLASVIESSAALPYAQRRTLWSAAHAAIWTVMSGGPIGGATFAARDDLIAESLLAYNNDQVDVSGWYVLSSSVDAPTVGRDGQEYLVRRVGVPEPGTLLLMGTGFLLLVGVNRRRLKDVLAHA